MVDIENVDACSFECLDLAKVILFNDRDSRISGHAHANNATCGVDTLGF